MAKQNTQHDSIQFLAIRGSDCESEPETTDPRDNADARIYRRMHDMLFRPSSVPGKLPKVPNLEAGAAEWSCMTGYIVKVARF